MSALSSELVPLPKRSRSEITLPRVRHFAVMCWTVPEPSFISRYSESTTGSPGRRSSAAIASECSGLT
jgi:hypothetical protein